MLGAETLDQIRSKTKLSSLIGREIRITRAGREWKALCPFHAEKTPSFTINDEKGFYHCFSCGAHGDAIRWMTEYRKLSFLDAVIKLAEEAAIPLPDSSAASSSRPTRGGSKLTRSETVTIRLDPKLNYLCDLSARKQRRTKSSFIEWAISNSLKNVEIEDFYGNPIDINSLSLRLWQVDEADRVANLALIAPDLLNHDEQVIWRTVRECGYFWKGQFNKQGDWAWDLRIESLVIERLRSNWDTVKAVALDDLPDSFLPTWQKTKVDEDDILF